MNIEKALSDAISAYANDRMKEITRKYVLEAQENIRRDIEREAMNIAMMVAQRMRIDRNEDVITISIHKR